MKRQKYDKDYLSEDICYPLMKGFCEEGSLNRKNDSPHMKHSGIHEDSSWENYLKEMTWQMKDTWMGCNN